MSDLKGKRALILVGDDYEEMELQYPKYRLREAGVEVVVAGLEAGAVHKGKYGYPQKSEAAIAELKAENFHALVIPGGWMPDRLRRYQEVKAITRGFEEQKKCIASICHGAWINISAGVVAGYRYTSTPGIRDDLVNAGVSEWVDAEVVVDGHHISSRKPDDGPAFCREILSWLAASERS